MEAPQREPGERPEPRPSTRLPEESAIRERPRIVARAAPATWEMEREDIVSWGAIWAGLVGTLAALVLLSLIGVGAGLSAAATPGGVTTPSTGAAIWGVVVTIIAFFFGGWLAARTATDASTLTGLLNGGMVWGLALLLSFAFAIVGLGSLLGLPIASVLGIIGPPGAVPAPTPAVPPAEASAVAVWTTVLALVLGLASALIGGVVGARAHPSAVGSR
ncbi:MAG: hypothetical protein HY331_05340 [Chloroflexi bacterium]|nr:hypothetical protein [Chloroflexota bacterium]